MYLPKSPFVLSIELTDKCNINCRHCLANANARQQDIPKGMLLSVIDESNDIGIKLLNLGGGEPFLYEYFFDILEYVQNVGLNLFFTTNGLLLLDRFDMLLKCIKNKKNIQVGISLDGHTPDIHSYFRPKDSFQPAVEAIRLLRESGFKLTVLCVLNRLNIRDMPSFLKFLIGLGVTEVRLLPFMPVGRGKQYLEEMLSPKEICDIIIEKSIWHKKFKMNISLHYPWEFLFLPPEKRQPSPCEAGYLRLWINSGGDIFPCSYMEDLPIGNIYRDSISDVWNNSPILKALRNPTLLKGTCGICGYRDGCRGGCRGLAYFMEGDYLCSDPYCPIVVQNKNVPA